MVSDILRKVFDGFYFFGKKNYEETTGSIGVRLPGEKAKKSSF